MVEQGERTRGDRAKRDAREWLPWLLLGAAALVGCTTLYAYSFADEGDSLWIGLLLSRGQRLYRLVDLATLDAPLRERLTAHQADPACSSCHKLMDGIGFSFEHFDAIGRRRETDAGKPIDARGTRGTIGIESGGAHQHWRRDDGRIDGRHGGRRVGCGDLQQHGGEPHGVVGCGRGGGPRNDRWTSHRTERLERAPNCDN